MLYMKLESIFNQCSGNTTHNHNYTIFKIVSMGDINGILIPSGCAVQGE